MAPRHRRNAPRSRTHPYRPDRSRTDHTGTPLCTCGNRRQASVHRGAATYVPTFDWAALATGERDD